MKITVEYSLNGVKDVEVTPEKLATMTEEDFRVLAWGAFKEDSLLAQYPDCPDTLSAHTEDGDELYFEVYPKFLTQKK